MTCDCFLFETKKENSNSAHSEDGGVEAKFSCRLRKLNLAILHISTYERMELQLFTLLPCWNYYTIDWKAVRANDV